MDWNYLGFSTSQVTINVGDELDIVNLDDTFDLRLTSGPAPENFHSDIPPVDTYVYYLPVTYNTPGTYSLSDEFGESVTVTVNSAQQPLSVIITDPTNNASYSDADQTQRQAYQPHQRHQDQRKQCHRPAKDKQERPTDKKQQHLHSATLP